MSLISLTPVDLSLCAILIIALAVLSFRFHLGIEKQLLIATARTVIQLFLLGLILNWVFARSTPLWVLGLWVVMLMVAGWEVMQRQKHKMSGWHGYGIGAAAMLFSSFSISLLALTLVISVKPWYTPQYAIPLLGMLLGNTMNGISLGLDRLTHTLWQQRAVIEARLMMGEKAQHAVADIRRDSLRSALMPIINAMSIAGLVSLPGMMTGQILSGSAPADAVKYQIMIMFLIAGGTGFGSIIAVTLASHRLFDERERLRLDRLGIG